MSPAGSCYYQQGLASGLRQRQGCLYPLPFWTLSPAESKVKSDLPQLPIGGGESGLLRKRSSGAERDGLHDSQLPCGGRFRLRYGASVRRGDADGSINYLKLEDEGCVRLFADRVRGVGTSLGVG